MDVEVLDYLSFSYSIRKFEQCGTHELFQISEMADIRHEFETRRVKFDELFSTVDMSSQAPASYLEAINIEFQPSKELFQVLFHLFNFHVVYRIPFPQTRHMAEVIDNFTEGVDRNKCLKFNVENYFTYVQLFKISTFLKADIPLLEINSPIFFQPSNTNKSKSCQKRWNKSTKLLGMVKPLKYEYVNSEQLCANFKNVYISPFQRLKSPSGTKFNLLLNNETSLIHCFQANVLQKLVQILGVESWEEIYLSNYHTASFVKPDLAIVAAKNNNPRSCIPIELKPIGGMKSFLQLFDDPVGTRSQNSVTGVSMFTQIVYQMLGASSKYGILTDYNDTVLIEITAPEQGIDRGLLSFQDGDVTNTINCQFLRLRSNDSKYSIMASLFVFMQGGIKTYTKQIQDGVNILSSQLALSAEDICKIIKNHYSFFGKIVGYVTEQLVLIPKQEEIITADDTHSRPATADGRFKNVTDQISRKFGFKMRSADTKLLHKLMGHEKWVKYSRIINNYNVVEIISGSKMNSTFGIVLLIKDLNNGRYYILKFYDAIRTRTYKYQYMNMRESYKYCTRYFNKEVASYIRLNDIAAVPKVHYFGIADTSSGEYHEELTLDTLDSLSGYFMITDYISGKTIDKLSSYEKRNLFPHAMAVLDEIHNLGVYHHDLIETNIMVKDGKVSVLDFGFAELREIRNEGLGDLRTSEIDPEDEMEKDRKMLCDAFSQPFLKNHFGAYIS